ncbi:MAG: DUF4386 family protein [Pseudomonadota bacterium]
MGRNWSIYAKLHTKMTDLASSIKENDDGKATVETVKDGGALVYKSGFFPKLLGVFLIIACAGYLVDSTTAILFPAVRPALTPFIGLTGIIGEAEKPSLRQGRVLIRVQAASVNLAPSR